MFTAAIGVVMAQAEVEMAKAKRRVQMLESMTPEQRSEFFKREAEHNRQLEIARASAPIVKCNCSHRRSTFSDSSVGYGGIGLFGLFGLFD